MPEDHVDQPRDMERAGGVRFHSEMAQKKAMPVHRLQLIEAVNGAVQERAATLSVWKVTPTPDAHHGLGTDGELQLLGRFLTP